MYKNAKTWTIPKCKHFRIIEVASTRKSVVDKAGKVDNLNVTELYNLHKAFAPFGYVKGR